MIFCEVLFFKNSKLEARNSKQIGMPKIQNSKQSIRSKFHLGMTQVRAMFCHFIFEFRYCFGLPWRDVSRIKRARYGISQLFSICVWPEIQVWARDFGIRISNLNVVIITIISHFTVEFDVTLE